MADNTLINAGSGGDSIRDKDRAGVKTQIFGLDVGIGGTEQLMASAALADATANPTIPAWASMGMLFNGTTWDRMRGDITNGLDVDVTRLPGSPAQEHTTAASPNGARLSDGAAFYDAAKTGQLPAALVSGRLDVNIGGASAVPTIANQETIADNAGFTDGTSKVFPGGYIFDDVAGTALTENDVAAARIDSKRAQAQVLEDGTTRGRYATIKAASTAAVATDTAQVVALSPNNEVGNLELPAPAAAADGLTNPTISQIGADNMLFNGTTWDRQYGNWRTTTGDTGAKTVTFNGATQTNFNARGAYITIQLGTVSGTTPTLSFRLQFSFDGGTTWGSMGPASGNLTTSNFLGLLAVYPTNFSQTAGSTPANVTSYANIDMFLNMVLPRTWRILYTIGGSSPSFAITAVHVSYLV